MDRRRLELVLQSPDRVPEQPIYPPHRPGGQRERRSVEQQARRPSRESELDEKLVKLVVGEVEEEEAAVEFGEREREREREKEREREREKRMRGRR